MTEPTATVPAPLPVGALLLPAALHAHDFTRYVSTQDYPIVREILDDARPVGNGSYLVCHRPVRETGDGPGPGYNLGTELTRLTAALSELLVHIRHANNPRVRSTHTFDYAAAGIDEELVEETRRAAQDAREAWSEQCAAECAQGPAWVELSRYATDGSIAVRLVCTCRCSHEARRIFDRVTDFEEAAAHPHLTNNLNRWGVTLTGPWADHRYASNRFGHVRTRRAPAALR
ncbi:hypothetical protein [Streptomyces sp. NPDC093223]|uniref:hypothetical protein n=1 Tax=Streptomyces sp. NPDC093223 TaxID=3366033 RepID=UPI0038003F8D